MDNFDKSGTWSLKNINSEIYNQLGFNKASLKSVDVFVSALLDETVTPENRFESLLALDKTLTGKNDKYFKLFVSVALATC